MQAEFIILMQQITIFITLIVVGFCVQKLKLINNEQIDALSSIVVNVILPCMIITVVSGGATLSEILSMLPFLLCSYGAIFMMLFIGHISGGLLRIKDPTRNVHTAMVCFPNSGFIGYPLLLAMFPKEAPLVIATYLVADATTIWTIGPVLTTPNSSIKNFNYKKLITPCTIALAISLLMIAFNIKFNNPVWDTITAVGASSKYLALIYIGADIGRRSFKKLFERPMVFSCIPLRLIICPLSVFFIIRALNVISSQYLVMLITICMVPSMVVISMLAKASGSDEEYASAGLLATTLASMLTMPAIMYLMTKFI